MDYLKDLDIFLKDIVNYETYLEIQNYFLLIKKHMEIDRQQSYIKGIERCIEMLEQSTKKKIKK